MKKIVLGIFLLIFCLSVTGCTSLNESANVSTETLGHLEDGIYGLNFIEHAKQIQTGMTLDEATQIMGFPPEKQTKTIYVWYDLETVNLVHVHVPEGNTIDDISLGIYE